MPRKRHVGCGPNEIFSVREKIVRDSITALTDAIKAAKDLHSKAVEGTAVGEYAKDSKATFKAAIDAAQAVLDDAAKKTQTEIDAAVTTLNNAKTNFEAGKVKAGNSAALTTAINEATTLYNGAKEGTAVGQYATGSRATFKAAIDAAQKVLDDAAKKTQTDIDAAVTTLNNAKTNFEAGKVKAGDSAALQTAINEANDLHSKAVEGTAVGQYATGSRATFKAAIDAAQKVLDDAAKKTQDELNAAVTTLNNAKTNFEAAVVK